MFIINASKIISNLIKIFFFAYGELAYISNQTRIVKISSTCSCGIVITLEKKVDKKWLKSFGIYRAFKKIKCVHQTPYSNL